MKSLRHLVSTLVALTLAVTLGGCGQNSSPTGLSPLDEAPPAAPSQVGMVMDLLTYGGALQWSASPSANVAGYRVYQYSPSPEREGAYVLVAETDAATTRMDLPWRYDSAMLYYRVRAVSGTGIQSAWSPVAAVLVGSPQRGTDEPRPPAEEPVRVPLGP